MGMEEILKCAMDHADETFARQIQYILEQLLSDEVDDDDAEDEEEDEDVDIEVGDSQALGHFVSSTFVHDVCAHIDLLSTLC